MRYEDEFTDERAEALVFLANTIREALTRMGTGDAATPMGAIELLAKETKEGSERIAGALADDVSVSISELADTVRLLAEVVGKKV